MCNHLVFPVAVRRSISAHSGLCFWRDLAAENLISNSLRKSDNTTVCLSQPFTVCLAESWSLLGSWLYHCLSLWKPALHCLSCSKLKSFELSLSLSLSLSLPPSLSLSLSLIIWDSEVCGTPGKKLYSAEQSDRKIQQKYYCVNPPRSNAMRNAAHKCYCPVPSTALRFATANCPLVLNRAVHYHVKAQYAVNAHPSLSVQNTLSVHWVTDLVNDHPPLCPFSPLSLLTAAKKSKWPWRFSSMILGSCCRHAHSNTDEKIGNRWSEETWVSTHTLCHHFMVTLLYKAVGYSTRSGSDCLS